VQPVDPDHAGASGAVQDRDEQVAVAAHKDAEQIRTKLPRRSDFEESPDCAVVLPYRLYPIGWLQAGSETNNAAT
jgi:hypothetical protein